MTIGRSPDLPDDSNFFRIFTIDGGQVSINNVTLANGIAPGTDFNNVGDVSGSRGGGINITSTSAQVNLDQVQLQDNQANNGGAIASSGNLTLSNSALVENQAVNGGGITIVDGTVRILNSTIAENTALRLGGGVFQSFGNLTLTNATVARNSVVDNLGQPVGQGGGIVVNTVTGAVNLKNTIIADNMALADLNVAQTATAPINSGGNNLINIISPGTSFSPATGVGDLFGTSAAPVDALLAPGFDPNGSTAVIGLLDGSPAIDAGNGTFTAPYTNPGGFDQRGSGFLRFQDIPGIGTDLMPGEVLGGANVIDIGAFEVQV
ncbi:MAG: hypothetical protein HC825_05315 [Oscillatoriales cyanobacterium RM1_1_9]|nr:hypothetical protein [Oscillatoriales cyanobacterium RM1_1_9]